MSAGELVLAVTVAVYHALLLVLIGRANVRIRAAERSRAEARRIAQDALDREDVSIATAERWLSSAQHLQSAYDLLNGAFGTERRGRLWALRMLASTASAAAQQPGVTPEDAEAYSSIAGEAMGQVIELEQQSAEVGIDLTEPADETDDAEHP